MRKYKAVLPESIAKEKARKAEMEKRKKEREALKKREAKKRAAQKEKEKKKKAEKKEREKEKKREEKAKLSEKREKERNKRKYLKRKQKRQAEKLAYYKEHKKEIDAEKKRKEAEKKEKRRVYMKAYNEARKTPEQIERARLKEEMRIKKEIEAKKKKKSIENRKYRNKVKAIEKHRLRCQKYYREHQGKENYLKHLNDTPGKFMIATARDGVVSKVRCRKSWWGDILEKWNAMVSENHENKMCPVDQISNSRKITQNTETEILLLKKINPEVEDNISVFRDNFGKIVKVKTDDEEWTIVSKEPWYVEEKFIVNNMNPLKSKQTAKWIGENLIEKDLSASNFKKVIKWCNYVIIDGDVDFDFCIGKTEKAALNLYLSLFEKYGNTEYVYFIGELDKTQVSKWTSKIREKTGWENLVKGKRTYFSKGSSSDADKTKSIPTSPSSTKSASSKTSADT